MREKIYICSPCRGKNYEDNIENAITWSSQVFRLGFLPVTPHIYFTRFLSDENSEERAAALEIGRELLQECSEVWVFGLDSPSEGMQAEIAQAIRCGIPVRDGDEILSGMKKSEHDDEIDARLYAAGAKRYARRRDPELVAAFEMLQKNVLDDFDRWLKRQQPRG